MLLNFQAADLKGIQDEIRKLKAVIVKHENRIRALEAKEKSRDEENNITNASEQNTTEAAAISNRISQVKLEPDEV